MPTQEKGRGIIYSIAVIIILWYLAYLILRMPIIPSPGAVLANITQVYTAKINVHVLYSLGRILSGIAISILLGVPFGYLMGYWETADRLLSPLVYLTYPVPKIALLPIVMLLFGLGEASKIIMIVMIIIFQIIVTARDTVKAIPQETFRSLKSLGAGKIQIFNQIIIPASLAEIITAIRLAVGTAISVLFFTETFGTEYGMGYFIMDSWMRVNYLDMYSGIVVLSLMGFVIFSLLDFTEKHLCSWR